MSTNRKCLWVLGITWLLIHPMMAEADPVGTAFTYQGSLDKDGQPVSDTCDFEFSMFDDPDAGNQISQTQALSEVNVVDGLLTVIVDFGEGAITGDARWLQIAVRCPAGEGEFQTLSPRQELTPTPHALALPGLWTQQNETSPNLIGGFSGNRVTAEVVGATISGGGGNSNLNQVTDDFGTVGGGANNRAGNNDGPPTDAQYATVGGGIGNRAVGEASTVGGGEDNTAGDVATVGGGSGNSAFGGGTVGGGDRNTALGRGSTVGGGERNTANGSLSTVPGGQLNQAAGALSFAAGRRAKANHNGTFVWADSVNADFFSTTINQFNVRANGGARFVMGTNAGLAAVKASVVNPTFTRAALQAENHGFAGTSGEAAWLRTARTNVNAPVLKLLRHPSGGGRNFYVEGFEWDGVNAPRRKFHINANGTYVAGSDFAEALPARGDRSDYAPGDVLVLSTEHPGSVEKCHRPYDTRVAGVYSTRPAVLGADKDGETRVDQNDIPVAIVGIVPTKATAQNGPIQAGDLLTTSGTPGHAMKASPVIVKGIEIYPTGAILGKALEPLSRGTGVIKVLVTPR